MSGGELRPLQTRLVGPGHDAGGYAVGGRCGAEAETRWVRIWFHEGTYKAFLTPVGQRARRPPAPK